MPYVHARSYKRQVIEKKKRGPRKGTAISAAKKTEVKVRTAWVAEAPERLLSPPPWPGDADRWSAA